MIKRDLIKLLENIPDDQEIYIAATPDINGFVNDIQCEIDGIDGICRITHEEEHIQAAILKLTDYSIGDEWEFNSEKSNSSTSIIEFDYDSGDDRSYGKLKYKIQTQIGLIEFESFINSGGGFENATMTIDGEEINNEDIDLPDPGLPHSYAGDTAIERAHKNAEKWTLKAIEEWIETYLNKQ